MNSRDIAERIRAYIHSENEVSMSFLYSHAEGRYSKTEMHDALEIIHRYKDIKKTVRGCDVIYCKNVVVQKREPINWRIPDSEYPECNDTNNGDHPIFESYDCSVLFMTPEEAKEYAQKNNTRD